MADEPKPELKPKKPYKSRFEPLSTKEMLALQSSIDPRAAYDGALKSVAGGIPEAGTDRWLWSNGVVSKGMEINLTNFGYMAHTKISHVEVIFPEAPAEGEERYILYRVTMPKKEVKRYLRNRARMKWLQDRTGLFWRWLLVKFLERNASMDVDRIIRRGVREYLGPNVPVAVDVLIEGRE